MCAKVAHVHRYPLVIRFLTNQSVCQAHSQQCVQLGREGSKCLTVTGHTSRGLRFVFRRQADSFRLDESIRDARFGKMDGDEDRAKNKDGMTSMTLAHRPLGGTLPYMYMDEIGKYIQHRWRSRLYNRPEALREFVLQ